MEKGHQFIIKSASNIVTLAVPVFDVIFSPHKLWLCVFGFQDYIV